MGQRSPGRRVGRSSPAGALLALALALVACGAGAPAGSPIKVGLVAPLSGPSGASGEAIRRGMELAVDEINAAGGVLGRPLAIVARDVPNDPPAGVAAMRELAEREHIVAVFGGIWGTVVVAQVPVLAELRLPLIDAWASVPAITRNGLQPNYAFRVSASDDSADDFLSRYAVEVVGARRPGLLMAETIWGDANLDGLKQELGRLGVEPAGVERFDQGDTDLRQPLERLRAAGADALIVVPDAGDGGSIVRAMAALGWKVPVVSHWGISGGAFLERAGVENADGVLTLQTFSFFGDQSPQAAAVLQAYNQRYGTRRVEEIPAQVGVAHGYDGMQLLARAIRQAGTVDGPAVRDALENLDPYDGLVKRYAPAFTPTDHDALHADDYLMAVWRGGRLVPAERSRIGP
ncbi:MAG TPA: ABC transporter substrate-binding protein [Chloroflexota bacterium]|jgi:branched-chain amino acid transport system substrate-binding protein